MTGLPTNSVKLLPASSILVTKIAGNVGPAVQTPTAAIYLQAASIACLPPMEETFFPGNATNRKIDPWFHNSPMKE